MLLVNQHHFILAVTEGCGEPTTKSKKFSTPKSDLATFHNKMSQGLGKAVVL